MEFKRNISSSCFGEFPSLASPAGWDAASAESVDLTAFGDVFRIEDLSEFSNEDIAAPIPSCHATLSSSSSHSAPTHGIWTSFTNDDFTLCPTLYEGMGLDWLSDSFMGSSDWGSFADSSNMADEKRTAEAGGHMDQNPVSKRERVVPGRARSKRSRVGRFRGWSYEDNGNGRREQIVKARRAEQGQQQPRRCTHCLSQRTPQWRAGPLGPKTLCNACGVRFKSGRLFPEYRPAKSPTFVGAFHSNSHKKVLEMRSGSNDGFQQPFKVKIKTSPSPSPSPVGLEELSSGSN